MIEFKPKAVFIPAYLKHPGVECVADITVTKAVTYYYEGLDAPPTEGLHVKEYKAGQTYRQYYLNHAQTLVNAYPECFRLCEVKEQLPENAKEGRDFDKTDCVLLAYDGDNWSGYCLDASGQEVYLRQGARWTTLEGEPTDEAEGRVEWLPDVWIVKLPQKEYWSDDIQAQVKEIFAVYAVDRMTHINICSFTPSYEMRFIEFQEVPTDAVSANERARDRLSSEILEAQGHEDDVSYMDVSDIEKAIGNKIRGGDTPEAGKAGAYFFGTNAVTWEGAVEEVMEARCDGI